MARYVSNNRTYQLPPDVKIKSTVEHPAENRIDSMKRKESSNYEYY